MAEMWIWNSMATRKRTPSDGFLENGLAILKGHLEARDHVIRIFDWHKNDFYNRSCPRVLLSLNRLSTRFIFWLSGKNKTLARIYFPIFNIIQELVSAVRGRRMKRRLVLFAREIVKNKIKIFGVKIWYGEAFVWANILAGYIKKLDPSILVIGGGFHATLYEDDFLRNSVFDIGVAAEGERPLEIILDVVQKNEADWNKDKVLADIISQVKEGKLKNVVYREFEKVAVSERYVTDLTNKSLPVFDKESLYGKIMIHVLLDSLGCPWGKCNFCVHSHFYPQFMARPVNDIIREIEFMIKQGVGFFKFAGSETPPAFGVKIAGAVLEKGLKIKYSICCRAINGISESKEKYASVVRDFETMLKAGLCAVFMGGESGNDIINEQVMNKGVKRKDIIVSAEAFRRAQQNTGIHAHLSLALIYPTPLVPGVTMEEVFEDNIKLVRGMNPDSVIVSPCTPFKHSKWYNERALFHMNVPADFIERMMKYEYVLYKPTSLWPPLGELFVMGLNFRQALDECGRMRKAVEDIGVPADLTDELFLMIESSGYKGKEGLSKFKKDTSIDLVSSDYRNIEAITKKTNIASRKLAESNR